MVASSVLPYLKRDGYRVTFNVTERGFDVLKNNPNIDEVWFQETDVVSAEKLGEFWDRISEGFDKVVQLNESMEVDCVAIQYRDKITKNDVSGIHRELRNKKYNLNYYENNIRKAGYEPVPPIKGELYFSDFEKKWMKDWWKKKIGNRFTVLWCLSGSGLNRVYPWAEYIIIEFLRQHKDAVCITTGEPLCAILEFIHPRTIAKSGIWNIRQSFLACAFSDLVVTVDTGILHAAGCYDDVDKIALLSAVTSDNVTKTFKNCVNLAAYDCSCYPCHTLIYNRREVCPMGETGSVMCLEMIRPELVLREMDVIYEKRMNRKEVATC